MMSGQKYKAFPARLRVKDKGVRQIFVERMQHEGRYKDWLVTLKRIQDQTGKKFGCVYWQAMREMGYRGAYEEWRLWSERNHGVAEKEQEYQEVEIALEHRERIVAEKKEQFERREIRRFEEAVLKLPARAAPKKELEWIQAHPAMLRQARQKDKTKMILLTEDDVESAPSKAAVCQLQHWCNKPVDFHKQMLSEQKKQIDQGGDGDGPLQDPTLPEVEALLKEVTGAFHVAA